MSGARHLPDAFLCQPGHEQAAKSWSSVNCRGIPTVSSELLPQAVCTKGYRRRCSMVLRNYLGYLAEALTASVFRRADPVVQRWRGDSASNPKPGHGLAVGPAGSGGRILYRRAGL
jgi:hypothetical protein